jgi:hypothetical protein
LKGRIRQAEELAKKGLAKMGFIPPTAAPSGTRGF